MKETRDAVDGGEGRPVRIDGTSVIVYQIYHDELSRLQIDPRFTPYLNAAVGPFFESAVIADLLRAGRHRGADYFGVFSCKFDAKIPIGSREMFRRMRRHRFGADAYSFFGGARDRRLWPLADAKHPGILAAASLVMRRIGIGVDLVRLESPIVYQNHFVCRSSLYDDFGREMLAPSLKAMPDPADVELQSLLQTDARYQPRSVRPSELIAIFGRPYYCLQPFIAERLFSTWLALNPAVSLHHIWSGRFVERANIRHEPELSPPRPPRDPDAAG